MNRKMKFLSKRLKLNSDGSALLTVLLFVAFLTILATTLLYVTGMNYIIKEADYQNKKNFYTNETALEEIKARLMVDVVSQAGKEAFVESSMMFSSAGETADSGDIRTVGYNGYFTDEVSKIIYDEMTAMGGYNWDNYLSSKKTDAKATVKVKKASVSVDGVNKTLSDETAAYQSSGNGTFIVDRDHGVITIKDIEVTYINEYGFAGVISTDLEIHAPEIDWTASKSEETFLDADTADGKDPKKKKEINTAKCVRYTNWVKKN